MGNAVMKNLFKKLTPDQSFAIARASAIIMIVFVAVGSLISLLATQTPIEEDQGVVYIDEDGRFHDFKTWDEFVKWTLQHKEKDTDFNIDYGEH